jgi:hypothetical protein
MHALIININMTTLFDIFWISREAQIKSSGVGHCIVVFGDY